MLTNSILKTGFCVISPDHYLNEDNAAYIHDLKKMFDTELEQDGTAQRKRAYLKLQWQRHSNTLLIPTNQIYYQSPVSNKMDGGKMRVFKVMPTVVLDNPLLKNILEKNIAFLKQYSPLKSEDQLIFGLHFIRYYVNRLSASYSSPDWLHKDDEPLVFIHLIHLSKAALGGDNLIADANSKQIRHVIRLENEIDTLVLNQDVFHAVTPLGSKSGVATRDVILFTVEPASTQKTFLEEKAQ